MSQPAAAAVTQHTPTQCEECLKVDDHPKVHYGIRTMHHDCTPESIRREIFHPASAHSVSEAATRAAFDAADSGIHGDDLRAHIAAVHEAEYPKFLQAQADAAAAAEPPQQATQVSDTAPAGPAAPAGQGQ